VRFYLVLCALAVSCAPPRVIEPTVARTEGSETTDVRALLSSRPVTDASSCLFVETGEGLALAAPLVSAVNPRPELPDDLARRLSRGEGDGLTLFTLYGQFGDGGAPLAAVTRHAPPLGPLVAIYLSASGAHVAAPRRETRGPLGLDELERELSSMGVDSSYLVALVPEASTKESALVAVLRAIDERGAEPALALPLPEGTRHRKRERETDFAGTCGTIEEGVPSGELPLPAIRAGVAELTADVRACRARSSSYEAARGGMLGLFVRVGADGRVAMACLDQDTVGDSALRACVLDAARSLAFEAPDPAGVVDLRLPLRMERDVSERKRGLCPSR
jgi:hypothetical protein